MRKLNLFIKRLIDFFGSLIGSIVISPILIIIALLIKLTSKGPVFFKQERLGKDGKTFKILKFRTMVVNAEKIGDGLTVKSENDDRITKIGKVLRKTSLDELPQLFNVILGQMSLVGPRPVSVKEAEQNGFDKEIPFWDLRFQMKPGMSGWAQVNYPYGTTLKEATRRMEYDIFYIKNNSLVIDLLVILKTMKSILYLNGR